ncbi:hypothetical protein [Burkholderia stabilis]
MRRDRQAFQLQGGRRRIELKNVGHQQHKGLNNQAENSREQARVREKVMRRFNSARQSRQFTSVEGQVENLFMGCRYHRNATQKHEACAQVAATRERASCTRWTAEADSRVSNMPQGVRLPNT